MSGVSPEKVSERGHEAGMRGPGSAVCGQAQGEEGPEGEGQAQQHHERVARNDQAGTRRKSNVLHLYSVDLMAISLQLSDSEKLPAINGVKPISPEQEELIQRLVYFQNEYEHPSEEDVKRIIVSLNWP